MFPSSQRPVTPLGRAGTPPRRVAVPAGAASYPRGVPAGGAPGAPPAYTPPLAYAVPRPPARPLIPPQVLWFLGWLSVAVVAALVILVVVWTVTNGVEERLHATPAGAPAAGGGPLSTQAHEAADRGDYFRAWQLYKEAASKGEGSKDQMNWNAAICAVNYAQMQADPAEARRACEEALTLAPDYGDADSALATVAARENQIEEAQTYFDAGVAAWKHRRDQQGLPQADRDEAGKRMQAVQQSEVNALILDGQQHAAAGELEIARKRYEDALRAAPPNSDAYRQA